MRLFLFLAFALALSACTGETLDRDASAPEAGSDDTSGATEVGFGDPIRGEITAVEADAEGDIEVGVTDEVVFFRLSEQARAEATKEIDEKASDERGGIGSAIADAVSGVVSKALLTTVQVPHDEIDALRYADGQLIVDGTGDGPQFSFGDNGEFDKGIPYDADAAQRLIDAFERQR